MGIIKKISGWVGDYMAYLVVIITLLALFAPSTTEWIQMAWINPLLMMIMFGMGLTLSTDDFRLVFTNPKHIALGVLAQYTVMPLLAWGLTKAFGITDPALIAGIVLVGTSPGGTSSNVITYLSRGDVALSVVITSCSTLLAPILTPLISYQILKSTVEVDAVAMLLSILNVVILPVILGFIINHFWYKHVQKVVDGLPLVSVAGIILIVAAVVTTNRDNIIQNGGMLLLVCAIHNGLGYLLGYSAGKFVGMPTSSCKTLSIEVGMQNSGLASALATQVFPTMPLATVPGAIFSVWHNISGAILAQIYQRIPNEDRALDK